MLLFLGTFETTSPHKPSIIALERLLAFAVDIDKLKKNFRICVKSGKALEEAVKEAKIGIYDNFCQ